MEQQLWKLDFNFLASAALSSSKDQTTFTTLNYSLAFMRCCARGEKKKYILHACCIFKVLKNFWLISEAVKIGNKLLDHMAFRCFEYPL